MSNTSIRESLERISARITGRPDIAKVKNSSAVATLADGLLCQTRGPNSEAVTTDMPAAMGGTGIAPNPGWLFRAALASCGATTIAMRAAKLGIPLSLLEVTVESESDNRGILGLDAEVPACFTQLTTRVRIGSHEASADTLEELVRWADAHSPVGCTVCRTSEYTLAVEVVPPEAS